MNLETDSPVEGASVAINKNYYAGSLNPEEELAQAFSSEEVLARAAIGTGREVLVVKAAGKSAYDMWPFPCKQLCQCKVGGQYHKRRCGKIYNNCAATILSTVDGEGGKWYQIQSGNVKGYIKAQYFITGAEAEVDCKTGGHTDGPRRQHVNS